MSGRVIGRGEMAQAIRSLDWSSTPLGPGERWPLSLSICTNMMLASPFPTAILWGDELILLYNDPYRVIAGEKHPDALGGSTKDIWSEVWHINKPIFEAVMSRGESIFLENQLFPIRRSGYHLEESYFTVSYSPIFLETGVVGGCLVTLIETTRQIIKDRRSSMLFELRQMLTKAQNHEELYRLISQTLERHPEDIPFALLYSCHEKIDHVQLCLSVGIPADTIASPVSIPLTHGMELPWSAEKIILGHDIHDLNDIEKFSRLLRSQNWPEPPRAALLVPLGRKGAAPLDFLVIGVAAGLVPDDDFRQFASLLSSAIVETMTEIEHREELLFKNKQLLRAFADYDNIFKNMMNGMAYCQMLFDESGRPQDFVYLSVNKAFAIHTGLQDVVGKRASEVIPGFCKADPELMEIYGRVALTGKPEACEIHLKSLNQWFSISVYQPLLGHFVTEFKVITERRRAETELARTRFMMTEAERIAHAGSFEYMVKSQETFWSEEQSRIFGLDPQKPSPSYADLVQKFVHPDDVAAVRDQFEACLRTGTVFASEHRIIRNDGSVRTVCHAAHPQFNEAGELVSYIGSTLDITARKQAEHALRESKTKLEAALSSMSDAVFITDIDGRFVEYNEAFVTYHRFKNREQCSKNFAECSDILEVFMADGQSAPPNQWAISRALRGESATYTEYTLRRKDTGETWIGGYSFAPIRGKEGQIVGSVVTARDITKRKQDELALQSFAHKMEETVAERTKELAETISEMKRVEEALRQSERQLSLVLENTGEIIAYHDIDHRLVWGNRAYMRAVESITQTEQKLSDLKGKKCYDLWALGQLCIGCPVTLAIETGSPCSSELTPQNQPHWPTTQGSWLVGGSPVKDEEGNIIGAIEIARDITASKLAEDALRWSERRLRRFYESGLIGVIYFHIDGKITDANEAFLTMVGYDREELTDGSLNWTHMTPAEYRHLDESAIREITASGGSTLPYEKEFVCKDGTRTPILIAGAMLDEKRLDGVAFVLDITERKRAEEKLKKLNKALEEANQAKTRFLATMSHDLRTPLNAVIGFSELLLMDSSANALAPKQRERVQPIADAGHHLLNLVEGLLNLSAIEAGKITLKKEMIDLNVMLEKLSMAYRLLAAQRNISWLCDINGTRHVFADKHRLWEVFNNLVNNALKYTPPQGSITLGAREGANEVVIFVKDTGLGIDKNDFERIFLPFEQGKSPGIYNRGKSVGLGLAICRQLVELHGGRLTVESTKGEGSCFTVTLPHPTEVKPPDSSWVITPVAY